MELSEGSAVELHSLSRADINGQRGYCSSWDATKERWGVLVIGGDGTPLGLRLANLKRVPPPTAENEQRSLTNIAEAAEALRAARGLKGSSAKAKAGEALALLEVAEGCDPSNAQLHQLRGDAAHMRGDHVSMVVHMRRAVANGNGTSEETASRLLALSAALGGLGDDAGEERLVRDVLKKMPGHIHARFSLAQCLDRCGRTDDAIPEFMMALQLPNTNPPLPERTLESIRGAARSSLCNTLGRQGTRWQGKGEHEKAASAFRRLLEVPSIDADMRARTEANLATSLVKMGNLEAAMEAVSRGIEADPPTPVVRAHALCTAAACKESLADARRAAREPAEDSAETSVDPEASDLYMQVKGSIRAYYSPLTTHHSPLTTHHSPLTTRTMLGTLLHTHR